MPKTSPPGEGGEDPRDEVKRSEFFNVLPRVHSGGMSSMFCFAFERTDNRDRMLTSFGVGMLGLFKQGGFDPPEIPQNNATHLLLWLL